MQEKLKNFLEKRDSLLQTRAKIVEKIREIDQLLGNAGAPPTFVIGQKRRRPKNEINLKQAISKALENGPKSRHEILEAVQGMGYQFSTNNPLNSLSAALYTNKQFIKDGQIYSLKGAAKKAAKPKKKATRKKK
jgi:hypothetical protein